MNSEERFLRMPEVIRRTGLSRSTIYRRIATKEFPEPLSLGGVISAWKLSEIEKWMSERQTKSSAA